MRQYVGARYVIKIYENTVNPESADWQSNTAYEPITLVTYNNSSYLSKKHVPPSIGNPADNPQYWTYTGYYNGQIASLQDQITALNSTVTDIANDVNDVSNGLSGEINTRATETATLTSALNDLASDINTDITNLQNSISAETSARSSADTLLGHRIDEIIAPSGEAPSAAEVTDARIDIWGDTHVSLGDAIRSQVKDLNDALDTYAELYYDRTFTRASSGAFFVRRPLKSGDVFYIKNKSLAASLSIRTVDASYQDVETFTSLIPDSNNTITLSADAFAFRFYFNDANGIVYVKQLNSLFEDLGYGFDYNMSKKVDIGLLPTSNYYNVDTRLINKDINGPTGEIVDAVGYAVSDRIFMDFTQSIAINGTSWKRAYCYTADGTYLGKVECANGAVIANTYATTAYIRIVSTMAQVEVSAMYGTSAAYSPYNPIVKYLEEYFDTGASFEEPVSLRLATYNMGDFAGNNMVSGSAEVAQAMKAAMCPINANIFTLQYDVGTFGGNDIYNTILAFKKYKSLLFNSNYNGNGFISDFAILNPTKVDYNFTPVYPLSHEWFYVCDIVIKGKTIKYICIHLDWSDKNNRALQIQQIKAYADQFDYVIISGDWNPDNYEAGQLIDTNLTYASDLAILTSGGDYVAANNGYFGSFDTMMSPSIPYDWPGDNIVVSSNIKINNAGIMTADYMNDHAIFYADITLY